MPVLVPCEGCRRHIRVDHGSCPFCATAVPDGFAKRAVPAATKRMDRLAVFTFATTIAVAACSGEVDDPGAGTGDAGGGKDSGGQVQDSGGKSDGGGKTDAKAGDGGIVEDDGGTQALYGAPIDAGPPDDGGVQAAYGLPPDAVAPPYGLPPLDSGSD